MIPELLSEIHRFEKIHQRTKESKDLALLSVKRSNLLKLLDASHIRYRELMLRSIHEYGNKCSKLLLHSIKTVRTSLYISKILSATEDMVNSSEGIAAKLYKFYKA